MPLPSLSPVTRHDLPPSLTTSSLLTAYPRESLASIHRLGFGDRCSGASGLGLVGWGPLGGRWACRACGGAW